MHYNLSLTVPANTLKAALVYADITMAAGVLKHIDILFPPGCARMVCCDIKNGSNVVYPKTASGYYAENGRKVPIDDMVIFDTAPTLRLEGWSPGTAYPHVLTAHFYLNTVEEVAMGETSYY